MMKTRITRFSRRSLSMVLAILMMFSIIMVGTISAVGYTSLASKTIYFDNTNTNYGTVYLYLGHGSYAKSYTMTNTGSHNIWKITFDSNTAWTDRTKLYFASRSDSPNGQNYGIDTQHGWPSNNQKTNLISANDADGGSCFFPAGNSNSDLSRHVIRVVAGDLASNSWDNKADLMTYSSSQHTYTYSNVAQGDYTFAVVGFDDWNTSYRWAAKGDLTGAGATWANAGDGDSNIKLSLPYTAPSVKVTLTSSNKVNVDVTPPSYTITYNKGSYGSGTVASTTKTYGTDATLSSSTFTRTGYTQDGWSTSDGGAKVYDLGGSYTTNADTTLYPHWSQNTYTVKKTETGASTAGTVKVGSTTITTSGVSIAHGTYTVTVTAPTGYNVSAVSIGGTAQSITPGSSVTINSVAITAAKTIAVTYALKTYTISLSETGATGGTLKVDGSAFTSGSTVTHGSHSFRVDAPDGYVISTISGIGTWTNNNTYATLGSTSITGAKTISVTYASASTPTLDAISDQSKTVNDTTFNVLATISDEDKKTGTLTVTVSSGETNVATVGSATVSGSSVTIPVTVVGPGTTTITVTLKDGGTTISTQTFSVSVAEPTFTITNKSIYVYHKNTTAATVTDGGVTPSSIAYTSGNTSYVTVNASTGKLTAAAVPTSNQAVTMTAVATYASGYTKSTTYTVTLQAPTLTAASSATSGNIGDTATGSVTGSKPDPNGSTSYITAYSWSSGNSNVVGITDNTTKTPTFTFKKAGSATITLTVTYKNTGLTKTATVSITVSDASVSFNSTSLLSINVGGTSTARSATGSTVGSAATTTLTYSGTNTYIDVNSSSCQIQGLKPTSSNQTVTATYTVTCGGQTTTKTATCTVTVKTPVITMANQTVAKGDSTTFSVSSITNVSNGAPTYSYSVSPSVSGVSVNASTGEVTVSDSCTASSATIKVTATKLNYTGTKTATLTIQAPTVTVADTENNSTKYLTVGTNYVKSLSANFTGVYSVTSSKSTVATGSVSGTSLTITPEAKGTSTITVTCTKSGALGVSGGTLTATMTFEVRVAEANTDVIIYLNDAVYNNGDAWGQAYVHAWGDNGTYANRAQMTKIGTNENGRGSYAYKFTAAQWADVKHLVFLKYSNTNWDTGSYDRTNDVFNGTHGSSTGFWLDTSLSGSYRGSGTFNPNITIPQVSIDDASTGIGTNYTMPAVKVTEADVGKYLWTSSDTSVATVTDDTGTTASNTVVPSSVNIGTSTITVKSYATAPTNWTFIYNDNTLPFLGTSDTAVVTVTAPPKTITFGNMLSTNGGSYTTTGALSAGTITATCNDSAVSSGSSIQHGSEVVFSANANTGYRIYGWRVSENGGAAVDHVGATWTQTVTSNTTVYALFVKTYQVNFSRTNNTGTSGISGKYGSNLNTSFSSGDYLDGASKVQIKLSLNTGYMIDETNSTIPSGWTVDAYAGTVTINSLTANATIGLRAKKIPYALSATATPTIQNTDVVFTNSSGTTISSAVLNDTYKLKVTLPSLSYDIGSVSITGVSAANIPEPEIDGRVYTYTFSLNSNQASAADSNNHTIAATVTLIARQPTITINPTSTQVYAGQSFNVNSLITKTVSPEIAVSYTYTFEDGSYTGGSDSTNTSGVFTAPSNLNNRSGDEITLNVVAKNNPAPGVVSAVDSEPAILTVYVRYTDAQVSFLALQDAFTEMGHESSTNYMTDQPEWTAYTAAVAAAQTALGTPTGSAFPDWDDETPTSQSLETKRAALEEAYNALDSIAKKTTIYALVKYNQRIYAKAVNVDSNTFDTRANPVGEHGASWNCYEMTYEATVQVGSAPRYLYSFTFYGAADVIVYQASQEGYCIDYNGEDSWDRKLSGDIKTKEKITANPAQYKSWYVDLKDNEPANDKNNKILSASDEYTPLSVSITTPRTKQTVSSEEYTLSALEVFLNDSANKTTSGSLAGSGAIINYTYRIEPVGTGNTVEVTQSKPWGKKSGGDYKVYLKAHLGESAEGGDFETVLSTNYHNVKVISDTIQFYFDMNGSVGVPTIYFENNNETIPYEADLVDGSESIYMAEAVVPNILDDAGGGQMSLNENKNLTIAKISVDGLDYHDGTNGSQLTFKAKVANSSTLWLRANSSSFTKFDIISYSSATATVKANIPGTAISDITTTGIVDEDVDGADIETYRITYAKYVAADSGIVTLSKFPFKLSVTAGDDILVNSTIKYFNQWNVPSGAGTAKYYNLSVLSPLTDNRTYTANYGNAADQKRVEVIYKFNDYDTSDGNYVFDENHYRDKLVPNTYTKMVKVSDFSNLADVASTNAPKIRSNYFDYTYDSETGIIETEDLESTANKKIITVQMKEKPHKYKITANGVPYIGYYQQTVQIDTGSNSYYWKMTLNGVSTTVSTGRYYTARFAMYQTSETTGGETYDCVTFTRVSGTGTVDHKSVIVTSHYELIDDATKVKHNFYIVDYIAGETAGNKKFVGGGVLYATTTSAGAYRQAYAGTVLASDPSRQTFINGVLHGEYDTEYPAQTIDNVGFKYLPYEGNEDVFRYSDLLSAYLYTYGMQFTNNYEDGRKLRVYSYYIYEDGSGNKQIVTSATYAEVTIKQTS